MKVAQQISELRGAELVEEPAFLTRIRLRARRRVLWLRFLWANGTTEWDQGLAISHSEVDRVLTGPAQLVSAEKAFYETDPQAQDLRAKIEEVDKRIASEGSLVRLCREFELSDLERDLLTLAVAAEVDPGLRRVYGYLNDDAAACGPTPWLAASLFEWAGAAAFSPESALVCWRLAHPVDGAVSPWSLTTPWLADPPIVNYLTQGDDSHPDVVLEPTFGNAVQYVAACRDRHCLYPALLADMQSFRQAVSSPRCVPVEIGFVGPPGAGKRTLALQFCAGLGQEMLIADAARLLVDEVIGATERAIRATRSAKMQDAVLYWHNADGVDPKIWAALPGSSALTLYGSETPLAPRAGDGVARKSFFLPTLTRAERIAFWTRLSDLPPPVPVADWMLTPAEITGAALVGQAGPEAVIEACRKPLQQSAGSLLAPLVCPYTWDDMVLPPGVRRHLQELETQARLRWSVYEEWGFEKLCPLGRGITVLFAGPSGTGKTMAAQVLARSLGMALYRIDLAGVMSKYIGETEKNLGQIFDACERANVLLFFDEADALFGQRTQVKDAHDRYANVEIDYLLQRMEQFDGLAALATNRKGDLDTAFLRRIRFIVDFLPPGPAERLRLWQLALPPCAPNGEKIREVLDWDFLANKLILTGAEIKATALGAAFLARAEEKSIGMSHVIHAARREMVKQGGVLRPGDLDGYDQGSNHAGTAH